MTTGRIEEWPGPDLRMLDVKMKLPNLPADLRLAFETRYPFCNGQPGTAANTWKEVASRLDLSEQQARRRVAAALKALRTAMEPEEVLQ